jgi:hypothetical protein
MIGWIISDIDIICLAETWSMRSLRSLTLKDLSLGMEQKNPAVKGYEAYLVILERAFLLTFNFIRLTLLINTFG